MLRRIIHKDFRQNIQNSLLIKVTLEINLNRPCRQLHKENKFII